MKITTKSRYALRFMLELSKNEKQGYMRLSDISSNQGLSRKYMENIVTTLKLAGLVKAERGKSGGYKLTKRPAEYTVGVIIKLFESSLEQASCEDCESRNIACQSNGISGESPSHPLGGSSGKSPSHSLGGRECSIIKLRKELDQSVNEVLEHTTLADLVSWEETGDEQ